MNVVEKSESIPVNYDVDVVVIGGGPAGVGAAFAAARSGRSVLVIEQMNCLGGIATAGWHGHLCLFSSWGGTERVVGGIGHEMCVKTVEAGYGVYDQAQLDFEVEGFKLVLENMARELKNLQILYYTQFCDVVMNDGALSHVIIQNKSGRQAVAAQMVIDCSGDADVAARSGAPFEIGRLGDGATQPMTLMFQIGGIDIEKVNQFRYHDYLTKYPGNDGNTYKLHSVWAEAQKNGEMEPFQAGIMGWWHTPTRPDQLGINFTHIVGGVATSAEDLTHATIEGRRQAFQTVDIYRKYIPGMKNCWMSHTASLVGTRESRRIVGDYVVTDADLIAQTEFDDSIGYGSFFIDIHNCTGAGMDDETFYPQNGFKYQIPYRALLPQNVNNLLVAGRCISCTHRALGSLRVMPQCVLEGEACGVAAAQAVERKVGTRGVDVKQVQKTLRDRGGILFSSDLVPLAK